MGHTAPIEPEGLHHMLEGDAFSMRARHTYREVFNIHTAPAGGDPFTIHLAYRRFPVIFNIAVFLY